MSSRDLHPFGIANPSGPQSFLKAAVLDSIQIQRPAPFGFSGPRRFPEQGKLFNVDPAQLTRCWCKESLALDKFSPSIIGIVNDSQSKLPETIDDYQLPSHIYNFQFAG